MEEVGFGDNLKFCRKCGGLLVPKGGGEGVLVCQVCGEEEKAEGSEYRMVKKVEEKVGVVVIEEEPSTLPTTKVKCPRCGNDRAYWWMRQTRSADEPSTRFYRCTRCGNTWREYA